MKKRYSLFLEGSVPAGRSDEVISFNVDMRTVIPMALRQKKFLLYSTFHLTLQTDDTGQATQHNNIIVGINLPGGMNKSYPSKPYAVIGLAKSLFAPSIGESFGYLENECMVKMIDYPEVDQINVHLRSIAGTLFGTSDGLGGLDESTMMINLTFEECDDEHYKK